MMDVVLISHSSGSTSKKCFVALLGNNAAPRCREFFKHFCDCFVDNMNIIGCTAIAKQGRWCGIRIYDLWAFCTNHYDITQNFFELVGCIIIMS